MTATIPHSWQLYSLLQQKDYPAMAKEVMELTAGKKRGELHSKLKEVAAEIEATEGRKVELIQRRILASGGEYLHRYVPSS